MFVSYNRNLWKIKMGTNLMHNGMCFCEKPKLETANVLQGYININRLKLKKKILRFLLSVFLLLTFANIKTSFKSKNPM